MYSGIKNLNKQQFAAYKKQEPCTYPCYGVLTSPDPERSPIVIQGYSRQHIIDILATHHNVGAFEYHEKIEGATVHTLLCDGTPSTLRVYENPVVIY